jgi:mRNA-degrading endonuclease RelE of RelBE toxin-antitoxin system
MSYSLLLTEKVQKQLSKLSKVNASRIADKLAAIKEDPHHYAEPCEGYPYYHQRIGQYRVIFVLNDTKRVIEVLKIGPRRNVYDR